MLHPSLHQLRQTSGHKDPADTEGGASGSIFLFVLRRTNYIKQKIKILKGEAVSCLEYFGCLFTV